MFSRLFSVILFVFASALQGAGAVEALEKLSDEGLPFYSVYGLDYLGEGIVNANITEDPLGRMLAIDNGVVMVFDGNAWSSKLRKSTNGSDSVKNVCLGADGRFYAGSVGMWGNLVTNSEGEFSFRASRRDSPEWTSAAHFDGVVPTSRGVIFYSTLGIVFQEYSSGRCAYWNGILPVNTVFEHAGQVYMTAGSGGVHRLVDDRWELVEGTAEMSSSEAVFRMVPTGDGRALLASYSGRLYLFDGKKLEPWVTTCSDLLSKGLVDMIRLRSGEYAFSVRGFGIMVMDAKGRQTMRLGVDHDEAFARVGALYQQENGLLWASLPSGIAKVYYPSQVSFYDYRFNMPMHWPEVYNYRNRMLVYSDYRMFFGHYDDRGQINHFEELRIPGMDLIESCYGYDDHIVFGSGGIIYSFDLVNPPVRVLEGISSARIFRPYADKDILMVLGSDRHAMLEYVDGAWKLVNTMPSMGFPAVVLKTNAGDIWVEHGLGRACRIWENDGRLEYQNFERIQGLENAWLNIWEYRGQVYLSTGSVIRRFDPDSASLVDASEMQGFIGMIGGNVSRVFEAPDGTVWASGQQGVVLVRSVDGKTVVDRDTLRPVSEAHPLIRFGKDGVVWMLSRNKVIRFNPQAVKASYNELLPRLAHVSATSYRSGEVESVALGSDESNPLVLPYEKNNITLRIFPNTSSLPTPPSYRYKLSGVSSTWSAPVREPMISFTNLYEGRYRLDVELLYQGISVGAISSYYFVIEPPLMRTWWAYTSYFFTLVAIILTIVSIAQRRSERERRRLERLVASRTCELDETNTRLRESIKSAMAAAEAKSRFLANMSHEIRTPMNGVVGTTELLARTPLTNEQKELVDIINKSGNLLLSIVNDVLDYSKIEADQLVFELIPLRPQSLVEDVLEILSEKANEKKLEFIGSFDPEAPVEFIGDTTRVQQVLVNLASNALKFTERGEVEIRGWASEREDGRWNLHFSVRDTGIGMDPRRMNRLFKAFTQLDASNTRVYGGTGLGLAISKRLVERMGGVMDVTSEPGRGSCFELSIPLPLSERRAPDDGAAGRSRSVLLADDCLPRQGAVHKYLTKAGFNVSAMSCAAAEGAISSGRHFDVVVLDCSSERSVWRDVADAVEDHAKGTPLIVYRKPLQDVEHPAVLRRLAKPWRCSRLVSEIRGCLDFNMERRLEAAAAYGEGEEEELSPMDLRVLLAEDNVVNQRVGVLLLAKLGIKPDLAINGREAVDLIERNDYDIVLMDVQMPVMDGIQATQAIRSNLPSDAQPIVVALTAGAMSSDREAAFSAGVDAYLTKPLRLEKLREQLAELMDKVQMHRSARRS